MKPLPNILFLITDQQRPDSLGCYGSKEAKTPNLDALAKDGVVFDNCYVSNPVCCPSRYSLCTGRYPHNHGVTENWKAPHPWETSFRPCSVTSRLPNRSHWQDAFYAMV